MKKNVISIILLVFCLSLQAQDRYTLKFDKANYSFSMKDNVLCIDTKESTVFYSEDTTSPAFPYSPFCILRPAGCFSDKYQVEMKKELIYENIDVEATPAVVPTRVVVTDTIHHPATASVNTPIIMGGNMSRGDYRYVYLKAAPFVFDIKSRSLYFISEMTITLPNESSPVKTELPEGVFPEEVSQEEVANMVINPEEMNKFYPKSSSSKIKKRMTTYSDPVDYVIITSNALANSFKDLASWKIKKGLHTKIVTVEQIYQTTSGNTNVLKIKKYLQQLYQNNGLKWVLLGGDTITVPSLMCKIMDGDFFSNKTVPSKTPTDLFYACFGGRFDWDQNQNGIYGELSDGVCLTPNIFVSRVPVRDTNDVLNFSAKVIDYESETTPGFKTYYNKLLLAATDDKHITSGKSQFRMQSEAMYSKFIQAYQTGTMDCIFDNYSNISGMSSLSATNLSSLINDGYHFIDVNSHGLAGCWSFCGSIYDYNVANKQTNTTHTIITTEACQTNRFDSIFDQGCLSRILLCSPHGGIAYFGSSRDGWGSGKGHLEYSAMYNGNFYKALFNDLFSSQKFNFGLVAAEAKKAMINEANAEDEKNRWLMFSINPMGDPEMPIYPSIAKHFLNPQITSEGTSVTVDAGRDCTIALTSADDGQSYFSVVHNVSSYTFDNVTSPFYVTLSKPNYVTYVSEQLFTMGNIRDNEHICESEVFYLDKSIPNGYEVSWSLENTPSGAYIQVNPASSKICTVYNPNHEFMDTYLIATASKGIFSYKATAKKRVIFDAPFSMTCSQEAGNYQNIVYNAVNPIKESKYTGYVVNPCCMIKLNSSNFRGMSISFEEEQPTTYYYDGGDEIRFVMPYKRYGYWFYVNGRGDGGCNDFRIRMMANPNPISSHASKDNNVSSSNRAIHVSAGNNCMETETWNIEISNAQTGVSVYKTHVTGKECTINTEGWKPGVYIIRKETGDDIQISKIAIR